MVLHDIECRIARPTFPRQRLGVLRRVTEIAHDSWLYCSKNNHCNTCACNNLSLGRKGLSQLCQQEPDLVAVARVVVAVNLEHVDIGSDACPLLARSWHRQCRLLLLVGVAETPNGFQVVYIEPYAILLNYKLAFR